jgi:hypothetical protein
MQQREHMGDVAQCRQTQQTDRTWRVGLGHVLVKLGP